MLLVAMRSSPDTFWRTCFFRETLNKPAFYGEPAQLCDAGINKIKVLAPLILPQKFLHLFNQRFLMCAGHAVTKNQSRQVDGKAVLFQRSVSRTLRQKKPAPRGWLKPNAEIHRTKLSRLVKLW
jgi:hypothetical protein